MVIVLVGQTLSILFPHCLLPQLFGINAAVRQRIGRRLDSSAFAFSNRHHLLARLLPLRPTPVVVPPFDCWINSSERWNIGLICELWSKAGLPTSYFWLDIALWFITSSKTGNSHNSICVTSENKWLPSNNEWHLLSGPVWPTKKCLLTSITTSGVSGLYLWRIKTFKDTLSVNSCHLKWSGGSKWRNKDDRQVLVPGGPVAFVVLLQVSFSFLLFLLAS